MKINRNKLVQYFKVRNIDVQLFIHEIGWDLKKFINMLFENGSLDEEEAMKFIQLVGAEDALKIINWRAMNVAKPKYRTIFPVSYANTCNTI